MLNDLAEQRIRLAVGELIIFIEQQQSGAIYRRNQCGNIARGPAQLAARILYKPLTGPDEHLHETRQVAILRNGCDPADGTARLHFSRRQLSQEGGFSIACRCLRKNQLRAARLDTIKKALPPQIHRATLHFRLLIADSVFVATHIDDQPNLRPTLLGGVMA